MIGYKAAKTLKGDVRVLITLEIPEDALTNCNRSNIVVKETAKYRANKVKVLKIEDENGKEYETAKTGFYINKHLIYKLNEIVEEPNFDNNLEEVCSSGIHFFLNKEVASKYDKKSIENGILIKYYDNGNKLEKCTYTNGKKEGLYQQWYSDGNKYIECTYKDGNKEGLYQRWYSNGNKLEECTYKNGEEEGLYQEWHSNGNKYKECTYKNGKKEGLYQRWYSNGNKWKESIYKNGKEEELYRTWFLNRGESLNLCI